MIPAARSGIDGRTSTRGTPETGSSGFNIVPFAAMAGGWLGPLLLFWLAVWGPLRPHDYPPGDIAPSPLAFALSFIACVAAWWAPRSWYRIRAVERSGRLYEALGVRWFRCIVPDGDIANRLRRRRDSGHRMIAGRGSGDEFAQRTIESERGHLVLLLVGVMSAAFAWSIGWYGWALYITAGNLLANVYPIMLQRYTRARLARLYTRPPLGMP